MFIMLSDERRRISMRLVIALFPAILLLGCKGATGPAGPPGQPVLPGSIRGIVTLYTELLPNTPAQDAGGVTVLFQPHNLSTITLTDGSWELTQVPMGVYSIKFTKPGYFTENRYNFQFVAGGGTYFFDGIPLKEVPSVNVQLDSLTNISSSGMAFHGSIGSPSPTGRYVSALLSRSPMDSSLLPFEFDATASIWVESDSLNFSSAEYFYPSLNGSTVYVVLFANSLYAWFPSTQNPQTGRFIFDTPGVLFSEQKSVLVP
jgi:hypothetical protein